MSKYFVLKTVFMLFILIQPIKGTSKNLETSLQSIYSQLETLKYAMDVIILHIEILETKTEMYLSPLLEGNKTINDICNNDNQKLLQTLVDDTKLIKQSIKQQDINNAVANLKAYLMENVNSSNSKSLEFSNSNNDTELLTAVLSKQLTLQKDFKLILERKKDTSLHDEHLNCLQNCADAARAYNSCESALALNAQNEGVYLIKLENSDLAPFYVYCKDKLMIIQRREDGSQDFFRIWNDYKNGFGDVFREYWIGLDRLHAITKNAPHALLIEIGDIYNIKKTVAYDKFNVGSENDGYNLQIGSFEGYIDDALSYHNGMNFSTYDRDNDQSLTNCARDMKGAWWYKNCYQCNLNGLYASNGSKGTIFWGSGTQMSYVQMAVMPLE